MFGRWLITYLEWAIVRPSPPWQDDTYLTPTDSDRATIKFYNRFSGLTLGCMKDEKGSLCMNNLLGADGAGSEGKFE